MTIDQFNAVFETTVERCRKVLCQKAYEYAEKDDRLHNFHVASVLQGCDPASSLGGMMIKHVVSLYDLIRRRSKGEKITKELFEEKIGDTINYLILLTAILEDEENSKTPVDSFTLRDLLSAPPTV